MIKINLLPSEKRKAERTPLPRFFLIVINAAALVLFGAGIAFYTLIKIPSLEARVADAQRTRSDLQSAVDEHDRLEKDLKALQAKVGQIDQLTRRDIEWWSAVNALWDVIVDNDKVWIDDIKMLEGKAAASEIKKGDSASKDAPPYGISMKCHVAGDEVETMTRFRTALKEHATLKKLLPGLNINVDWKKTDEKDFSEAHALNFAVVLMGPVQAPAAPAGAAPKKGAKAVPAPVK
ncbi:MAG TPA: hypothetical protein VF950_06470 [Planctomycetota bacterium]